VLAASDMELWHRRLRKILTKNIFVTVLLDDPLQDHLMHFDRCGVE
jgi:hypothetical protein